MVAQTRMGRVSYVPPQHGAWAFLALPLLVGITCTTWQPAIALLAGAWICAYPVSYFVMAALGEHGRRNPRRRRFIRPTLPWLFGLLAFGIPLLLLDTWLIWVVLAMSMSACVSAVFAVRHDQRAVVNDAVVIVQCSAMVPVTWAVGQVTAYWPPATVWWLTVLVALALASSTIHVRSFIRGRGDRTMARMAVVTPMIGMACALIASAATGQARMSLIALAFAFDIARAIALQQRASRGNTPKPMRIGMVELVGFAIFVATAALAQG